MRPQSNLAETLLLLGTSTGAAAGTHPSAAGSAGQGGRFGGTQAPAAGSAGQGGRCRLIDLCVKIVTLADNQKRVEKSGKVFKVAEMEITDDSIQEGMQTISSVSLWNDVFDRMRSIDVGTRVTIVRMSVVAEDGVKLNLWGSSMHIIPGGDGAQAMTDMRFETESASAVRLTSVSSAKRINVDMPALPTCAAAVSAAISTQCQALLTQETDKCFQINRCLIDAPTMADLLYTEDKQRLYARASVRDWTGQCEVDVVESAVPAMFGLSSKEAVANQLKENYLALEQRRVNVRGVLRREGSSTKAMVAQIEVSPLMVKVSSNALCHILGLSTITGDVVMPAPIGAVATCPVLGLVVNTATPSSIKRGAHRILLLVTGTEPSVLQSLTKDNKSFLVVSTHVRCLLSDKEALLDLRGYCDCDNMLQYRLDKDAALVTISAVTPSVSGRPQCTVESMTKVSRDEQASLVSSLEMEWRAAVQPQHSTEAMESPMSSDYWETPRSKIRRISSEPPSAKQHV